MKWLAGVLLALAACSGGALTAKAPPLDIHYFALDHTSQRRNPPATTAWIRVAPIRTSASLRSRIAKRVSTNELEFYEDQRWADAPDRYVRYALESSLLEHGIGETEDRDALELEVAIIVFEETAPPQQGGRVSLRYRLLDRDTVVLDRVVTIQKPSAVAMTSVVAAIGSALDAAVAEITDQVVAAAAARQPARRPRERSSD
jgi:ABC-type uncharacterized transport system auxiliary subunit